MGKVKNGCYNIPTSGFLNKVAKSVLIHVKANKTVYIQVGKVVAYGVLGSTGLVLTSVVANASGGGIDDKATAIFFQLADYCGWVIVIKAVWDMAVCVMNGEVSKAPSVGVSYLLVIVTLYVLPFGLEMIKELFTL